MPLTLTQEWQKGYLYSGLWLTSQSLHNNVFSELFESVSVYLAVLNMGLFV